MFFRRNKNKTKTSELDQSKSNPTHIVAHIDAPTEYPRATLFKISGWVASNTPLNSINVGQQEMVLHDRPDVLSARSEYAYATGFSGLARERDIRNQELIVLANNDNESLSATVSLPKDVMLALSKREKLQKLNSLYPNADPVELLVASEQSEVSNDNDVKFKKLQSILKCQQCAAIGIQQNEDGLECENGHRVDTLGYAYIYLNAEMRATHNIQNNIDPASRAQDPLAIALIGKFKDGLILDCGAGLPFQNYKNVVNFEIEKFSNTDVIGVGEELPFADHSFDAVFSFSVLEHVKDPFKCAAEIERVLKPGGVIYSSVPFLIPVHGYPHHYYNMTQQGLANLFSDDIDIIEGGVPISGHPLFALNSIANIWNNSLNEEDKEAFGKLSLKQIMDDPAKLIPNSYCADLPQDTQRLISCTNMILAQKN